MECPRVRPAGLLSKFACPKRCSSSRQRGPSRRLARSTGHVFRKRETVVTSSWASISLTRPSISSLRPAFSRNSDRGPSGGGVPGGDTPLASVAPVGGGQWKNILDLRASAWPRPPVREGAPREKDGARYGLGQRAYLGLPRLTEAVAGTGCDKKSSRCTTLAPLARSPRGGSWWQRPFFNTVTHQNACFWRFGVGVTTSVRAKVV